MLSHKRISNEYNEIKDSILNIPIMDHRIIDIQYINDDIFQIEICFLGPLETPYEELINTIHIKLNNQYPNKPPIIKFINKIYHPNIDSKNGNICLDILNDNWKPIFTLRTIMLSIISLLSDPNPDSPLNTEAAIKYKDSLKSKMNRINYLREINKYHN